MEKIVLLAESVRTWLEDNIGIGAAFAVLCLLVFGFVYGFRKLFPNAWIWMVKRVPYLDFDQTPLLLLLDKTVQAIPGTVFAAAMGALSSGGSVKAAALASLAGPLMALMHHILEAIPWVPYLGRLGKRARLPSVPVQFDSILILIGAGFFLSTMTSCNLFGKSGPVWPSVAKCSPSEASIKQEAFELVKGILLSGVSDWKDQISDAGLKYGASTVVCIVNSLVADWGAPGSPARESKRAQTARSRGELFLQDTGTKVEQ